MLGTIWFHPLVYPFILFFICSIPTTLKRPIFDIEITSFEEHYNCAPKVTAVDFLHERYLFDIEYLCKGCNLNGSYLH